MSQSRIFYQTERVFIPANTLVTATEARPRLRFLPNSLANRCTGVAIYVNTAPAILYRIGLRTDNDIIQDLTNWRDWVADTNVPHNARYKEFNFEVFSQNQITLMLDMLEANGATPISIDAVFRLIP
jgi:hypothetical protein